MRVPRAPSGRSHGLGPHRGEKSNDRPRMKGCCLRTRGAEHVREGRDVAGGAPPAVTNLRLARAPPPPVPHRPTDPQKHHKYVPAAGADRTKAPVGMGAADMRGDRSHRKTVWWWGCGLLLRGGHSGSPRPRGCSGRRTTPCSVVFCEIVAVLTGVVARAQLTARASQMAVLPPRPPPRPPTPLYPAGDSFPNTNVAPGRVRQGGPHATGPRTRQPRWQLHVLSTHGGCGLW